MDNAERHQALERLDRMADALDAQFRVPGTDWRVGWDGLVGLIPGVGDTVTGVVSLGLVAEARRLGAPPGTIARMLLNVGIDLVVGGIPLVGDLFDFAFKVNQRNIRLLHRALEDAANA